ncbi:MAG TPA: hypothetical protein VGB55_02890, partial [Tepidisphaeraceae bacterium]
MGRLRYSKMLEVATELAVGLAGGSIDFNTKTRRHKDTKKCSHVVWTSCPPNFKDEGGQDAHATLRTAFPSFFL